MDRIIIGKTNVEIGEDLGISARTIEIHRGSAIKKLGAWNTASLVWIGLTGELPPQRPGLTRPQD